MSPFIFLYWTCITRGVKANILSGKKQTVTQQYYMSPCLSRKEICICMCIPIHIQRKDRSDSKPEWQKRRGSRRIKGKDKKWEKKKRVKAKFALKKKNLEFGLHAYYHKRKRFKYLPSASKIHVIKWLFAWYWITEVIW